jgi:hypothetical protein
MEEMYWRILLEIQRQRHMLLVFLETKEHMFIYEYIIYILVNTTRDSEVQCVLVNIFRDAEESVVDVLT